MRKRTYTKTVHLRVSDTTAEDIEELAKKLGCNISEAIRRAVLMANRFLEDKE